MQTKVRSYGPVPLWKDFVFSMSQSICVNLLKKPSLTQQLDDKGHDDRIKEFVAFRVENIQIVNGKEVKMSVLILNTLRWDLSLLAKWSFTSALASDQYQSLA